MSASITNIINVALIPEGRLAARTNMNVCAVFTSDQNVLSTAERYRLYASASDVESDFGTSADITSHAQVFFSQQPNAVNAGGLFVAAYWRGTDETTTATAATLEGEQLSEATTVGALQQITDGSFNITVDGGIETVVTGLDFSGVTDFAGIVSVLDAAVTADGVTVTEEDQSIVFTSDTTGATSTLTYLSDGGTGTFVGEILALTSGSGAVLTQGADSVVLSAETKEDAVSALFSEITFRAFTFIDNPTDDESRDLASWAQANSVIGFDVFDSATNLETDAGTNIVWELKLSGYTNYRMLYSKAGNRKLATGYMARAHTVNFNAENSALTMHLKEIKGVPAEEYTQTEIKKAKNVGLDIYTTVKDVPVLLTSPANDFWDNVYNLIAFVDAAQIDLFNLLKQTGTKIPQTKRGVNQLVDQGEKTTRGFVRAGVFAPGTWSSPDFFGNIDVFNRNIEKYGFYWLAGELSDQPQADRQARKSPVLQAAVKNAGAIHSADVIINFNA